MNSASVEEAVAEMLTSMYSLDQGKQKAAISTYFDKECRLQNPYLILSTREEITRLFASLANQNLTLSAEFESIGTLRFYLTFLKFLTLFSRSRQ
jgi:hypothetical protein